MVRNLTSWCGLLVGLGLALEPAQAGDRKSTDRVHKAGDEMVMSREIHVVSLKHDVSDLSAVRPFEARYSSSTGKTPANENEKEHPTAPGARREPLTLFNIKSNLGDIAVQPMMGPAKGVQFSLGF